LYQSARQPRTDVLSRVALEEETIVATGKVKWFNKTKGYGFIQPDDGSKDVFVHISAVEKAGLGTLAEGQSVQFEVARGKDGKASADQLKAT
jgi:cold shock protein